MNNADQSSTGISLMHKKNTHSHFLYFENSRQMEL